jgi:hypothetical protein
VLAVVVSTSLACGGLPGGDDVTLVGEGVSGPAARIVGTWQILPEANEHRRLRVIDAAIYGKPLKRIGTLTSDEQVTYDAWKLKSGPELDAMKAQLEFLKHCTFEFTPTHVTVRVDDAVHGPAPYSVVSADTTHVTLRFDPGMGHGVETHDITWTSDVKGIDQVTADDGSVFVPLQVTKIH